MSKTDNTDSGSSFEPDSEPRLEPGSGYCLEQKIEHVFEEIIYNTDRTNLTHLRRLSWNGVPDRFRAPAWQLMLHYLPATKSKRKSIIRRRRNEYHRRITKYYFEFDFCLTDRPLRPRTQEEPSNNSRKDGSCESNDRARKIRFPEPRLLLFQGDHQTSSSTNEKVGAVTREDSLLLQIRNDINNMVDIPITSRQQQQKTSKLIMLPTNFKTATATTTNRSFANTRIKSCLERILYLWSVKNKGKKSSTTFIRYVPGMTDIVYPIFLTFLQGYVWETHSASSEEGEENDIRWNYDLNAKTNSLMRKMLRKLENDPHFDLKGFFRDNDIQTMGTGNKVVGNEDRNLKTAKCKELCFGKGLDEFSDETLEEIEADVYWCLDNLMTAIQDFRYENVIESSSARNDIPSNAKGLQSMIVLMDEIVNRVDPILHTHLKSNGVEFLWFAFRWMNSLLVRDLNDKCILRLWDTCLSEEAEGTEIGMNYYSTFGFNPERVRKKLHLSGFHSFQVYVCAALLHHVRETILLKKKFADILQELQNLPLDNWDVHDISMLLSQAFAWKEIFHGSERQLLLQSTTQYGSDKISKWIKKCHWPPRIFGKNLSGSAW